MKEAREITYRCGHTETVTYYSRKGGRDGRSYLDWKFENLEYNDCSECRKKKGTEMGMKMYYSCGKFYAGIVSRDSYLYKEILRDAGMKYDDDYNWHFVFKDRNYKVELDRKIELLRQKNIIITEVDENEALDDALHSLRWKAIEQCRKKMVSESPKYLQPYLQGKEKDVPKEYMEECEKIRMPVRNEIKRILSMSFNQVEIYLSGVTDPMNEQEAEEFKSLQSSAVLEVQNLMITHIPEFVAEGKWNKTFYGKKGNYSIYINGVERKISDEEYREYQRYELDMEGFSRAKEKIMAMNLGQLRGKKYLGEVEKEELRRNAKSEARTEVILMKPDCIRGYYWNGKYYGESKRNIYRDNVRYTLSDEEFQSIQDYQDSFKKYDDILEIINNMSLEDLREKAYRKFFTGEKVITD